MLSPDVQRIFGSVPLCGVISFVLLWGVAGVASVFGQGMATADEPVALSEMVERAHRLESTQRFNEAAAVYREVLARRPDDDEIRGRIARVLSWQGQFEAAGDLYRDILSRHPADTDIRVALARVLSWQQRFDESEQLYRAVLEEVPDSQEAKRGLADTLAWSGRLRDAGALYEDLYRERPEPELAKRIDAVKGALHASGQAALKQHVARAREQAWQGQYDEAIAQYQAVLQQDASNIEAQQGLADTFYWSGRYAEALALYQAVQARTNDPALPARIQAVNMELGLSPRALVGRGAGGIALPFRDYLKIGYSHYTYTNRVPDEQSWLVEMAKPIGDMTLVGRIEPMRRFGQHDLPISAELYSPLWRSAWGYVGGGGASNAQFVSIWSMGGEVFQGLGPMSARLAPLEVSFGYRRMEYKAVGIDVLTPGVTVYLPGNIWITEKLSYVPAQGAMTLFSRVTWRPRERLQVYVSGGYGTAGERIVAAQDFARIRTVIGQGGMIFPITERFSGEVSGYYEDRGALYVRRGVTFNLLWHW